MQKWTSYHIYPLETPDVFLARGVRPFLDEHIWPVKNTRAFFIRYEDEQGPHIRLRFRGEEDWLAGTLQPAVYDWFEPRGTMEEVPYEPEPERFGGDEAQEWAEEYFHLSTRVVLDRLNRPFTYGDAMFDALRMHVITAYAAGWDREKSAWYFEQLCRQWIDLFFEPRGETAPEKDWQSALLNDFEEAFIPQQEDLRLAITELWDALFKGKFDAEQPEWLRWLRGNEMILKEYGSYLEKGLPSLLHLTNNRLGINNQDEVYLNYLLSRTL
ncbi:MAG: hypothetical protein EP344_09625 [Bacteroidetes bacterium]|nr:MAG: hypothetical protein EP344_09625 [Bacteroidota bacterium]